MLSAGQDAVHRTLIEYDQRRVTIGDERYLPVIILIVRRIRKVVVRLLETALCIFLSNDTSRAAESRERS